MDTEGLTETADVLRQKQLVEGLFTPFRLGSCELRNRLVMAPMTREFSPNGVIRPESTAYYRRRAEAGVGLIITEGTWIDHPVSSNRTSVPRFHGEDALAGWKDVVAAVHSEGGLIFPQLWHVGTVRKQADGISSRPDLKSVGPSGIGFKDPRKAEPEVQGETLTEAGIEEVVRSFARGARDAYEAGFDGIELHGAHGYLIDQFFWNVTNLRTDAFGGSIRARSRFAAAVVRACREAVPAGYPISLRISQWKVANYNAQLFSTPDELAEFLEPLTDAGVDVFHCSTRRYWDAAFPGDERPLSAWVKQISGKPTITVGSVGLDREYESRAHDTAGYIAKAAPLDRLVQMFDKGYFDLVGVGRSMLADPGWIRKIRSGRHDEIVPFTLEARGVLY